MGAISKPAAGLLSVAPPLLGIRWGDQLSGYTCSAVSVVRIPEESETPFLARRGSKSPEIPLGGWIFRSDGTMIASGMEIILRFGPARNAQRRMVQTVFQPAVPGAPMIK